MKRKPTRSPLVKARDEWFESGEGRRCDSNLNFHTACTEAELTHNNLALAFNAGYRAGRKQNDENT